MLKRQQQKRQQKMIRRRKAMPLRAPQQANSPQQLEQLLSTLPTLAFEPELADLSMGEEELRKQLSSKRNEVEILMELLTTEFIADLDQRLEQLENANTEKSLKSILAKATRHQIANSEKIPYLSNPVIIAIFLKTRSTVEGTALELADLAPAMEEFDSRNHDHIQELTAQLEASEKGGESPASAEEQLQEEPPEEVIPAIDGTVYKKYLALLPEEKQERLEEDLDVFLTDFQPPLVAEWDLALIKNFMGNWFKENANPLEEDLLSMRESLISLFEFLANEELLTNDFLAEVSEYLNNS